jgi:hypothetical protein
MYYFFLFIIPILISFFTIYIAKDSKIVNYILKFLIYFSILLFTYIIILGLVTKTTMLSSYFENFDKYPSLILSEFFMEILFNVIIPIGILLILIKICNYLGR